MKAILKTEEVTVVMQQAKILQVSFSDTIVDGIISVDIINPHALLIMIMIIFIHKLKIDSSKLIY